MQSVFEEVDLEAARSAPAGYTRTHRNNAHLDHPEVDPDDPGAPELPGDPPQRDHRTPPPKTSLRAGQVFTKSGKSTSSRPP